MSGDPGAPPTGTRPCIVLGVETQIGLALVRELGRAGVPVIAVSHDPRAIGLASRHVWRRELVAAPRSEALLERLRALGDAFGPCSLLTTSEANLGWLSRHREQLGRVRPALPPAQALEVVLDKARTLQQARAVGMAVPRTEEPVSLVHAQQVAASFPFPAVLKWKDPPRVAPGLTRLGLELLKAEYVHNAEELLAACRRYEPLGQWPLVQQYCRGHGLGQFFFMHQGQAVRRFQHRRVAEWPPEGGFSSVCDAVPLHQHQALQAQSVALLQAIGWEGVAMVEYRFDPASGQAVLMEINGRFWGSFPLAASAGAGFGLLCHDAALGNPLRSLPPVRQDLRCRMVATEIKRLGRILFQRGRIADRSFVVAPTAELLRFLADFVRPRVRYYVWSAEDPRPFGRDLLNALRSALGKAD